MQLNATALQLDVHISFSCKCTWMNGMPMCNIMLCLFNLLTTTLPLVVRVNFSCKCHG